MSPGARNMKTGPDALGTAGNDSRSTKDENWIRHPRYRRKHVRARKTLKWEPTPSVSPKTSPGAQNMKTGPIGLGTAENMSESAKHENGIGRPRYRRK
jgi:hypothetical protein